MHRCSYNCVIGQCYQTAWDMEDDGRYYCFYHKGVKRGKFIPGESYGEEMFDE